MRPSPTDPGSVRLCGRCQSKFYTACLRIRMGQSSTVFVHELPTRSAGFDAESRTLERSWTIDASRDAAQALIATDTNELSADIFLGKEGRSLSSRRRSCRERRFNKERLMSNAMMEWTQRRWRFAAAGSVAACALSFGAGSAAAADCASLAAKTFGDATITAATSVVPPSSVAGIEPLGPVPITAPMCRVQGSIKASADFEHHVRCMAAGRSGLERQI